MPVFINEETKLFHLQTKNTSYIFQILANEAAGQVYYGAKVPVKPSYSNLMTMEEHDCTNTLSEENTSFQLELVKQEYATQGKGTSARPPTLSNTQTAPGPANLNTRVTKSKREKAPAGSAIFV